MSDPTFNMPPLSAGFDIRAGWVLNRLRQDLAPLAPAQAAGIVGNLGGESGLKAVQEVSPRAGRGGFGWAQWTGPRRTAFEAWCAAHSLDQTSDEANYGFLVAELKDEIDGDHQSHSLEQIRKTTTLEAAVYTFEVIFERPADLQSGLADREEFARRALAASGAQPTPQPEPLPSPDESADELNRQELGRIKAGLPPLPPTPSGSDNAQADPSGGTGAGNTPHMAPAVALGYSGGSVALLAGNIQFLWPLLHGQMPDPPTGEQATNLGGGLLMLGTALAHIWNSKRGKITP